MERGAYISACGRYRYALERVWDRRMPRILFIGLNPSVADAELDDPTLKRCIGFARAWGHGGVLIGNLFAYRATDPDELTLIEDPVGPENDTWLVRLRSAVDIAVAAWGNRGSLQGRAGRIAQSLGRLHCLGTTHSGAPRHPLYVRGTTPPVPWIV